MLDVWTGGAGIPGVRDGVYNVQTVGAAPPGLVVQVSLPVNTIHAVRVEAIAFRVDVVNGEGLGGLYTVRPYRLGAGVLSLGALVTINQQTTLGGGSISIVSGADFYRIAANGVAAKTIQWRVRVTIIPLSV